MAAVERDGDNLNDLHLHVGSHRLYSRLDSDIAEDEKEEAEEQGEEEAEKKRSRSRNSPNRSLEVGGAEREEIHGEEWFQVAGTSRVQRESCKYALILKVYKTSSDTLSTRTCGDIRWSTPSSLQARK